MTRPGVQALLPAGEGWRCWRVMRTDSGLRLRNPWTNSGMVDPWEPYELKRARCFWSSSSSHSFVSAACSCGIRSMSTLPLLAEWMKRDRQLERHPAKATVVGRIALYGHVERQIPGLSPKPGYQRAEAARLTGPLYVSPLGAWHADGLTAVYAPTGVTVVPPASPAEEVGQQEWLTALAASVSTPVRSEPDNG